MKKFTAVLFALILMLALCVAVGAATIPGGGNVNQNNVTVAVTNVVTYGYNVTWDSLDFVYNYGAWDPQSQSYPSAGWKDDNTEADVTVSNLSNAEIWYTIAYTDNDQTVIPAGVTFTDPATVNGSLEACAVGGTPDSGTLTVTIGGTPNDKNVSQIILGTINVTVYDANPNP